MEFTFNHNETQDNCVDMDNCQCSDWAFDTRFDDDVTSDASCG